MYAEIHKHGKIHTQEFKRGIPQGDMQIIGDTDKNGSIISFIPDDTIFDTIEYSYNIIATRLRHAAYLTPGVSFTFIDETSGKQERFYFEGGIKTWLMNLAGTQKKLSEQFFIDREGKDCWAEISFQFVDSTNDNIMSFVNNITTKDGGMHVLGFKDALLKVINEVAQAEGEIDKKIGEFQISDITDGLYAIVTVKIPEPQFEGQTKGRLGNSYVRKEVSKIVYEYLSEYFKENTDVIK